MMLSYIWVSFFLLGFISCLFRYVFLHQTDVFQILVNKIFATSGDAVQISIGLIGVMTLFLGFMEISERSGLIQKLSKLVFPFFSKLFPSVKKEDPAMGNMMMNYAANLLGLDNAATPFGLKAIENLQNNNPSKDTASDSQIMFVVLHASGLTLIPISILAQRIILNSKNPTSIFIPCILATYFTTLAAIFIVAIKQKLKIFTPKFLILLGGITSLIVLFIFLVPKQYLQWISQVGSNFLILSLFIFFIIYGLTKRINIFDTFITGAKKGFDISIKLIPYLVAMLVAITILKDSQVLTFIIKSIQKVFIFFHINADFVPALSTAIMKPISGSGARAMMIDTMQEYGPDSFIGQLSCIFNGSADTTLYIVALYFGSVQIKNIRYTITASLLADLIGIICSIILAYLFF